MPSKPAKAAAPAAPALHYRIEAANPHAHLYSVRLTIEQPAALQRVSLPVWIPGSYMVREFSKNLQKLTARQGSRAVALQQVDKNTWDVTAQPARALVLEYEVYANDPSVRTAWLDAARGFFNNTSLCLRVHGQEDRPHELEVLPGKAPVPAGKGKTQAAPWQLATGLAPRSIDKAGFGSYVAADYDELADCPVEMGAFWSGEFKAAGVPHRFVVAGAPPSFDGERLLADARRICETVLHFWHGKHRPKFKSYLFMLNAVDEGYGGLEHRNSTALICNRRDLPRRGDSRSSEGYTTLQGLICHEYFHAWNVKQLRPAEFARYHYDAEQYTQLLWFFEGFTSYYDDLLLRRAGLLDNALYLKLLNKTLNQVQQAPGRFVQSVAEASMDAWVKYYRQDENTPNATISYYTKGALVALCFDLALRHEGRTNLDEVMRALWARCVTTPGGGTMGEDDFAAVLAELGGRSFAPEIAAWVHGRDELPLKELLARHGVALHDDPAQLAQRVGLRISEVQSLQVKVVLRGSAAEQAGLVAGDEWLGIETPDGGWRMTRFDELPLYAGSHQKVQVLVARDRRLLKLPLVLPAADAVTTARLAVEDTKAVDRWLN